MCTRNDIENDYPPIDTSLHKNHKRSLDATTVELNTKRIQAIGKVDIIKPHYLKL